MHLTRRDPAEGRRVALDQVKQSVMGNRLDLICATRRVHPRDKSPHASQVRVVDGIMHHPTVLAATTIGPLPTPHPHGSISNMRTGQIAVSTLLAVLLSGCGSGGEATDPAAKPSSTTSQTATTTEESGSTEPSTLVAEPTDAKSSDGEPKSAAGDACALLDRAYLNDLMQDETTMLGTPYAFQEPLGESPSSSCAWKEGSTGLTLQVTLEPATTSEIDDHSGRAYNIDVQPVAVPQDGPGTSAVLLTDPAFENSSDENFAYGYFFVADEVTVFVKSVGLDLGAKKLRAMADEAAERIAAG